MIGIPQTSTGIGRFGVTPPNASSPRVGNTQSPTDAGVEVPWYASGPAWVLVFLVVGYILVFQTLKN
jgi:hypothetical protein